MITDVFDQNLFILQEKEEMEYKPGQDTTTNLQDPQLQPETEITVFTNTIIEKVRQEKQGSFLKGAAAALVAVAIFRIVLR